MIFTLQEPPSYFLENMKMAYWFQTEARQGKSMLTYSEQLRGGWVECPNKEAVHLRGLTVYNGIKFDNNKHSVVCCLFILFLILCTVTWRYECYFLVLKTIAVKYCFYH